MVQTGSGKNGRRDRPARSSGYSARRRWSIATYDPNHDRIRKQNYAVDLAIQKFAMMLIDAIAYLRLGEESTQIHRNAPLR